MDYENKRLQKEQHEQIESLKIVQAASSDTESAMALFREIDADGSGQLDEEEFGNLVTCMGKYYFCVCVNVFLSTHKMLQFLFSNTILTFSRHLLQQSIN